MPTMPSRRALLRAAAALATAASARPTPAGAQQDPGDPTLGRRLVFDESFASIDPAIWQEVSRSPARSASARSGTSPADDTRFGSSNTADVRVRV